MMMMMMMMVRVVVVVMMVAMMMMSIFIAHDSINLNAQFAEGGNEKKEKKEKTSKQTNKQKMVLSHSQNRCVFRQGVCLPDCLW